MDSHTAVISDEAAVSHGGTSHGHVEHHFEDAGQQKDAATIGMWVFLVTEVMFFGGLFLAYFVYRQWYPAAFASASNNTNLLIGAVNTTVLICSSLTMALAVRCAALGKKNLIVLFLILTLLLGGTFLGVKALRILTTSGSSTRCRAIISTAVPNQACPALMQRTRRCSSRSISG